MLLSFIIVLIYDVVAYGSWWVAQAMNCIIPEWDFNTDCGHNSYYGTRAFNKLEQSL